MTWKLWTAMHRVNTVCSSEVSLSVSLCCRQLTAATVLWKQWLYTWMPRDTKISPPNTLYRKGIKELQNRLRHLCGQFHYCKKNWRLLSTVRNIWHHRSSFLEGRKHHCECVLYSGYCCLWFERLFRLCASPVSSAASPTIRSHPRDQLSWLVFTAFYSVHQQLQSQGNVIRLRGVWLGRNRGAVLGVADRFFSSSERPHRLRGRPLCLPSNGCWSLLEGWRGGGKEGYSGRCVKQTTYSI